MQFHQRTPHQWFSPFEELWPLRHYRMYFEYPPYSHLGGLYLQFHQRTPHQWFSLFEELWPYLRSQRVVQKYSSPSGHPRSQSHGHPKCIQVSTSLYPRLKSSYPQTDSLCPLRHLIGNRENRYHLSKENSQREIHLGKSLRIS